MFSGRATESKTKRVSDQLLPVGRTTETLKAQMTSQQEISHYWFPPLNSNNNNHIYINILYDILYINTQYNININYVYFKCVFKVNEFSECSQSFWFWFQD